MLFIMFFVNNLLYKHLYIVLYVLSYVLGNTKYQNLGPTHIPFLFLKNPLWQIHPLMQFLPIGDVEQSK